MENILSIDSLGKLNAKLLAEISELRKENDKIPELEKKFAEVENAKLKQIIEENAMRDARVKELEQKNTELEARLAISDGIPMEFVGIYWNLCKFYISNTVQIS
ncbi:unnamed protein product [Rhizophagus irregularis]|uniref:Uncharacterized protein n=1 Tax=Rhizophagus irregularis TaxID=588596 RepID=A0A2I1HLB8_9GLOM|nr:hypothetical protein RhiirA4_516021 [Rhizophagus irregularis]CAB4402368.1 unnamed protein product [Rhizophagus irregularis]